MRVFIDTNLWAYRLDQREPEKSAYIKHWLRGIAEERDIVVSTHVLIELQRALQRGPEPRPPRWRPGRPQPASRHGAKRLRLITEFKRRNVIRAALFYIVVAWVVVQVAETLLPVFDVPDSAIRTVVLILALGFPLALVFYW